MSVVTLTFTSSDEQITSGIPRYLTIESNIPSTIYYTTDGTTPTTNSTIYVDTITLSDNQASVIVSAFGVDNLSDSGPILTQTFAANQTKIDRTRMVGQEGLNLYTDDTNPEYTVGYDANGNPATFINFEPELIDMDTIHSEKGFGGEAEGTYVKISTPEPSATQSRKYDTFVPFSTTKVAEFFDPYARVIFIDNRETNDMNPVLRPWGSLENVYNEFGGKRVREVSDDASYISGGWVRRFYNAANNTMVSYYFDHNEARWIRNIQQLPVGAPAMPRSVGVAADAKRPLIFAWIYRGRQSGIV